MSTLPSLSAAQQSHRAVGKLSGVRIFAIGSPHGDDRASWEAAARLSRLPGLAGAVVCLDSPIALALQLEGLELAIILDACRSGAAAGAVRQVSVSELDVGPSPQRSTHGVSVGDALITAAALHGSLPEIVVLALEIQTTEPGEGLSEPVRRGVVRMEGAVVEELRRRGIPASGESTMRVEAPATPRGGEHS